MNETQETTFDQAGFEAFFKTHPNDASVEEPPTDVDVDTPTDGDTEANNNQTQEDTNNTDNQEKVDSTQGDGLGNSDKAQQQAHAFAQMRIANKQQQQLLSQIAQIVGIKNTNDTNAMLEALQGLANKAQAQKQNVPEELIARLNALEANNQEYQRQQAYLAAGRGFQTIKDKYNLSNNDLEAFAQELIADGVNPYETVVDLVSEYRNRHFDDLMEKAMQRGIEQEAQRAAKAGKQSSTPTTTTGGSNDNEESKITTVDQLNKWLDEHKM